MKTYYNGQTYPRTRTATTNTEQRRLLGQFIRSYRERVPPEIAAGRRRTPGLRREELAARAGIGATWCAWIEQDRDVSVSPAALAPLAAVLALTPAERSNLFELAVQRDPPQSEPADEAPASLRAPVDAVRHLANGLDRLWNACCWNPAAEPLFVGWLGADYQRNLLRYAFTEPSAQKLLPAWEDRAMRLLTEFRVDYGRTLHDLRTRALADQLKTHSEPLTPVGIYRT